MVQRMINQLLRRSQPERAVVYCPVPGPGARQHLIVATQACESAGHDVIDVVTHAPAVQTWMDDRAVDVVMVSEVEHRDMLHRHGVTPRIEVAHQHYPPLGERRPRWRR